jgi:hypothetical protein
VVEHIIACIYQLVFGEVMPREVPSADSCGHDRFARFLDEQVSMLIVLDDVLRLADSLEQLLHHGFSKVGIWLFVFHTDPRLLTIPSSHSHKTCLFLFGVLVNPVCVYRQAHNPSFI